MTGAEVPCIRTPDENFNGVDFPYEAHYVDLGGLRMHYVDEGPTGGPIALLLHGMPTWSYLYRTIIPVLSRAGYRCIAPDHIGFGRSDKVTDAGWYDIARHTANLTKLIDVLDLVNITLFVQDWGGPIGLAQVVTMPERFARLVIMNTWLHHDGYEYSAGIQNWITQNQPGGLFRENIPDRFNWGTLMVVGTSRADPQEALFPALQGDRAELPPEVDAVRHAYDAPFAGLGETAITGPRQFPLSIPLVDADRGNGTAQARHFAAINATGLPVHFVWGLTDNVFTSEWGRRWHAMIPNATWDGLDDAGHFLQDTHGERIAEIVLSRTS